MAERAPASPDDVALLGEKERRFLLRIRVYSTAARQLLAAGSLLLVFASCMATVVWGAPLLLLPATRLTTDKVEPVVGFAVRRTLGDIVTNVYAPELCRNHSDQSLSRSSLCRRDEAEELLLEGLNQGPR